MLRYAALSAAMRRFRKNKEEKEFLVFPLRVQIPVTGGGHTIEVDVRKEGCQEEAAGYRNGSRVEVRV